MRRSCFRLFLCSCECSAFIPSVNKGEGEEDGRLGRLTVLSAALKRSPNKPPALPLIVLYEVSIVAVWLLGRKRLAGFGEVEKKEGTVE